MDHGVEIETCGWKDLPCLSIHSALAHKGESITQVSLLSTTSSHHSDPIPITLNTDTTITNYTGVPFKSISALSSEVTHPTSLFAVSAGAVTFSYISFILEQDSKVIVPVFAATGGSLSLLPASLSVHLMTVHSL